MDSIASNSTKMFKPSTNTSQPPLFKSKNLMICCAGNLGETLLIFF